MEQARAQANDYAPGAYPDLPPPPSEVGVWAWLRARFFAGPLNIALTLLSVWFLVAIIPPILDWSVLSAAWAGSGVQDCPPASEGACWFFIGARIKVFLTGFYPWEELWRPAAAFVLLLVALIPAVFESLPWRRHLLWLAAFYPIAAFLLLSGGLGLPHIQTADWGGLLLTLVVGITGIVASLPIGIVLALGRQSDMPVVAWLCIAFIELVRAVPLITLLFMASVMLPLFMPGGHSVDKLLRALIIVSLFAAAYMAEVVRGGLQAIPRGQVEAAEALGLGYWQTMGLIVLPQALRIVIPGIVNTFIGLFKDTTLVSVIGLMDLLGVAEAALQDTDWIGRPGGLFLEAYAFVALVFFVFCHLMSQYSLRLEARLGADGQGARR